MTRAHHPPRAPAATYPRTFIEGTLGLPGIIQEVITVELQQDPPPPKVKGQLGSGPAHRLEQNPILGYMDTKTKTRWRGRDAGVGEVRGVRETPPPEKRPQRKGLGCKFESKGAPSTTSEAPQHAFLELSRTLPPHLNPSSAPGPSPSASLVTHLAGPVTCATSSQHVSVCPFP